MQKKNRAWRGPALAALMGLAAFASDASAATVSEALRAYNASRVAESEGMLRAIAADPAASAADRAQALRELGRIDGLVRGETDAIAVAMAQTPDGPESCETAQVALRVYRTANQPASALAYADAASGNCAPGQAEALHVERAQSLLALAAADPGERAAHLTAAATQLAAVDAAAGKSPSVAGARFSLALAQRDPAAAFAAWRDYYWLNGADAPSALHAYSGRVRALLDRGLSGAVADADALALLELLTRAGFTADARQYAAELGLAARNAANPAWRRLDSFFTFDATVRAIALRANREIAAGGRARSFERDIRAATSSLLAANNLSGDPIALLAEHFGVYGTLGETSGYPSLHAGHLVQRDRLSVSQYGRNAEVEFIVIDHMLSNGYESWLWDGRAQAGGWSSDGATIVQVRSAYTSGPLQALRRIRPGPERDRFLAKIERDAAEERRVLGADGLEPLNATGNRLLLQAWEQMATRAGADDAAFIAENWRATNQYSIEDHEGRHALDNLHQRGLSTADLEFRAKLSQIIFADYPRLGLASVANNGINSTPHGVGNRRVLEGFRAWMRAHRSEIAGYEPAQPTLSQLPLLTDAQIVEAARSMDPWARQTNAR